MSLAPGKRLAHYEIVARLGEGGMGQVYRAKDGKLDREIAIKVRSQPQHLGVRPRATFDDSSDVWLGQPSSPMEPGRTKADVLVEPVGSFQP